MRAITLQAPAKLNLHLGIHTQLDERQYHKADSLMVALRLCDEVVVREMSKAPADSHAGLPLVDCAPPIDVPPQKNTVYRAAHALANLVGRVPNVRITVYKHIPDQAGMGGSSSDAAAVLRALCELWDISVQDDRVAEAARSVGADVPFFLDPVPTLLVGAGDVVQEKFSPFGRPIPVALLRPKGPGVSTPAAYAAFDKCPEMPSSPEALCSLLRKGDVEPRQIAQCLANNLEPVACRLLPQVEEVRSWLVAQEGAMGVQVTGSGSCVFAVCDANDDAQRIVRKARESLDVWACATHMA